MGLEPFSSTLSEFPVLILFDLLHPQNHEYSDVIYADLCVCLQVRGSPDPATEGRGVALAAGGLQARAQEGARNEGQVSLILRLRDLTS